ncbi:SCO6880 family protein [Streptodolium elevatio]|uniref:SCO6880 family protein n=1 Tax=Streptodolium elevatio TaxID=3157996 RepID=A0ABV3DD05_9ACTN
MTNRVKSPGAERTGPARDAPRRARAVEATPMGAVRLPGLAFAHRLVAARDAYGRPYALLAATPGTHTAVLTAEGGDTLGPGATGSGRAGPERAGSPSASKSAVSARAVSEWAENWTEVIASLGDHPHLVAATVAVRVDPTGLRGHVGLTWRTAPEGRRSRWRLGGTGAVEAAAIVGAALPRVCSTLESALDTAVVPLTTQALSGLVRSAYDPSVARMVDAMPASAAEGPKWGQAAPRSSLDAWDHLAHDGCASVTWVMSGAPDHEPFAGLVGDGLPGATTTRLALLHRRPVAGHAPPHGGSRAMRPTTLLTATYATVRQARDAALDHLSLGTQVRLRRAYGCQAAAFAAALPLGVQVPTGLRPPQTPRHVP